MKIEVTDRELLYIIDAVQTIGERYKDRLAEGKYDFPPELLEIYLADQKIVEELTKRLIDIKEKINE